MEKPWNVERSSITLTREEFAMYYEMFNNYKDICASVHFLKQQIAELKEDITKLFEHMQNTGEAVSDLQAHALRQCKDRVDALFGSEKK